MGAVETLAPATMGGAAGYAAGGSPQPQAPGIAPYPGGGNMPQQPQGPAATAGGPTQYQMPSRGQRVLAGGVLGLTDALAGTNNLGGYMGAIYGMPLANARMANMDARTKYAQAGTDYTRQRAAGHAQMLPHEIQSEQALGRMRDTAATRNYYQGEGARVDAAVKGATAPAKTAEGVAKAKTAIGKAPMSDAQVADAVEVLETSLKHYDRNMPGYHDQVHAKIQEFFDNNTDRLSEAQRQQLELRWLQNWNYQPRVRRGDWGVPPGGGAASGGIPQWVG
jgi:hypothetical protein